MSTARENAEAALTRADAWMRPDVPTEATELLDMVSFALGVLLAETAPTEWEWGSEGKEGTSDPDPRPLEEDRAYWPDDLRGVRELTREQADAVIAAWNAGDPESASLIRRRKAGPWEVCDG